MSLLCECGKVWPSRKSFHQHMRGFHKTEPDGVRKYEHKNPMPQTVKKEETRKRQRIELELPAESKDKEVEKLHKKVKRRVRDANRFAEKKRAKVFHSLWFVQLLGFLLDLSDLTTLATC